jgi:hypothetical protein
MWSTCTCKACVILDEKSFQSCGKITIDHIYNNDIVDFVGTMSDYNSSFNDIVDLVRTMSDYNGSI